MAFEINNNVSNNLFKNNLSNDESLAARKAALDLATHIEQRAEGSRFPGRLRVHNLKSVFKGGENPIQVKRANWFKNIFTSTNHVQKSSVYLRSLLSAAYKDKISPEAYEKIMAKVDKHLSKNLGFDGFGSRHFARFVREFESAPQLFKSAPTTKFYDPETNALLNAKIVKSIGSSSKTYNQVLTDIKTALSSMASDEEGVVNNIAQGSEGAVFGLEINNLDKVVKININNPLNANDGIRSGDLGAAYFKKNNFNYLVIPDKYIVEVKKDGVNAQLYEVHRDELKNFISEVKNIGQSLGKAVDISIRGTYMELAQGKSLGAINKEGALGDKDFENLAVGLYCGLEEMRMRGVVHHDIKPANVMFDSAMGKTKIVDLGAMVKLSKKKDELSQTTERMGTPPFQSPTALHGNPHGAEVDRFSYAVTLLCALEPKVSSPETIKNLSSYFGGHIKELNADGQPKTFEPSEYLNEYMRALEAAHPNEAKALIEKFQTNPVFRELIHLSFVASAGGAGGNRAWSELRREAFPASNLETKSIQKINHALKEQYFLNSENSLSDIFSKVAENNNFNYALSDFNYDSLNLNIEDGIKNASKKQNKNFNSKIVQNEDMNPVIEGFVTKFIENKINIFSAIDSKPIDAKLKAVLIEQFKLDSNLKLKHVDKLIDIVPKISSYLSSIQSNDIKNSFINLVKLRIEIESSLIGEAMDFQQSFLEATMRYASLLGVDLREKFNSLMSPESRDFYSLLVPDRIFESSALLRTINDEAKRNLIAPFIGNDIAFMNSLINNVGENIGNIGVNIFDIVNPAEKVGETDRDFILNKIYVPAVVNRKNN